MRIVLRRTYGREKDSVSSNIALCDDDFKFCGAVVKLSVMQMFFLKNGNVDLIRRKELVILKHFATNENTIVSRRNLIHNVWGKHANIRNRALDQYIVKVRQLLKDDGSNANALRILHGIGYIYATKPGIPERTGRE